MPGPNDRGRDDERRLSGDPNSLLLDALERLAILETTNRFTELQRGELLATIAKLSGQLGDIAGGIRSVSEILVRLAALEARAHAHDLVFAETKGGVRAAKLAWSVIWALIGASIAVLGLWFKRGQ